MNNLVFLYTTYPFRMPNLWKYFGFISSITCYSSGRVLIKHTQYGYFHKNLIIKCRRHIGRHFAICFVKQRVYVFSSKHIEMPSSFLICSRMKKFVFSYIIKPFLMPNLLKISGYLPLITITCYSSGRVLITHPILIKIIHALCKQTAIERHCIMFNSKILYYNLLFVVSTTTHAYTSRLLVDVGTVVVILANKPCLRPFLREVFLQ